jgi:formamidopyrimidine-DNA glycosylase
MPEMPEIEILDKQLRKAVVGKHIAEVRLSGLPLRKPIENTFVSKLRGRTVRKIMRRGKYIVVELEPKVFLLIHLGMSGRILYRMQRGTPCKHTHAVFRFSDFTELEYRDHRRFGLLAAYEVLHPGQIPEIRCLGMDPLSTGFCGQWLLTQLQKSRSEIKSFLLNQRKLAGLGNIYVCESLFFSRLHPARRCYSLTAEEATHLANAIQKVLRVAIRHNGTSFSDFTDSDGKPGENQDYLAVFNKEGEKCVRCGAPIQRMRQGNRSSFYCSRCQN